MKGENDKDGNGGLSNHGLLPTAAAMRKSPDSRRGRAWSYAHEN